MAVQGGREALMALLVAAALDGCAHRPLLCTLVKVDDQPALACQDSRDVPHTTIRPYAPAPAPQFPEREPGKLGPYWRYKGDDEL